MRLARWHWFRPPPWSSVRSFEQTAERRRAVPLHAPTPVPSTAKIALMLSPMPLSRALAERVRRVRVPRGLVL